MGRLAPAATRPRTSTTVHARLRRAIKVPRSAKTPSVPRPVTRTPTLAQQRLPRKTRRPMSMALVLALEQVPVAVLARDALRSGPSLRQLPAFPVSPLIRDRASPKLMKKTGALQTTTPDGDEGSWPRTRPTRKGPYPTRQRGQRRTRRTPSGGVQRAPYTEVAVPLRPATFASTKPRLACLPPSTVLRTPAILHHLLARERTSLPIRPPRTPRRPAGSRLAGRRLRPTAAVLLAVRTSIHRSPARTSAPARAAPVQVRS